MKQQPLTRDEKDALISYRISRAKETLLETDLLAKENFFNAAINRMYYACYYAIAALLIKNDIVAETHNGVKRMFSLHFISTSLIDKKYSIFYSRLFNDRISGDYDDFIQYNATMFSEVRPIADDFISAIEDLL